MPSPLVSPLSVTSTSAVASPYVSASFLGQPDLPAVGTSKTETPPDTNGAVGRDKLMVPLNSNYVIQRKSDGATLSRVSMTAFWKPVGAHNPFDPRVLYDPYSNRWLASAADDPLLSSSLILYGISDTDDPLGSWHLYAIHSDETGATWADFPTLGFSRSTVAIGVNMFSRSSLNYVRGRLIVLDYPSLRAGSGGNPQGIDIPGEFAMQPAVTYSPTETTIYLVEHLDSLSATYRFWSLSGSTLTLVGGAPRTNPLGGYASAGAFDLEPQQGGDGISAGDARIGSVVFRNGHVWYAQIGRAAAGRHRLRDRHRGGVGRARHERRLRPGRADRGPAGEPVERRPFLCLRLAGGKRAQTTCSSGSPSSSPTTSRTRATPSAPAPTRRA